MKRDERDPAVTQSILRELDGPKLIGIARKAADEGDSGLFGAVLIESDDRGRDDIVHVTRKLWNERSYTGGRGVRPNG